MPNIKRKKEMKEKNERKKDKEKRWKKTLNLEGVSIFFVKDDGHQSPLIYGFNSQ